jgi:hypothetical protein
MDPAPPRGVSKDGTCFIRSVSNFIDAPNMFCAPTLDLVGSCVVTILMDSKEN